MRNQVAVATLALYVDGRACAGADDGASPFEDKAVAAVLSCRHFGPAMPKIACPILVSACPFVLKHASPLVQISNPIFNHFTTPNSFFIIQFFLILTCLEQ